MRILSSLRPSPSQAGNHPSPIENKYSKAQVCEPHCYWRPSHGFPCPRPKPSSAHRSREW